MAASLRRGHQRTERVPLLMATSYIIAENYLLDLLLLQPSTPPPPIVDCRSVNMLAFHRWMTGSLSAWTSA